MLPLVRLPSLDLMKGFVAVARRMSVTHAADDLCLTQSAISKQLRTLEDSLGVPLFHRGFRSLTLTEHGQMLFRVADQAIAEIQQAVTLLGPPQRSPVNITASTGVAGLWLLPRIGQFQTSHPMIDVRLIASNAVLELGAGVDLAVRYCSERQAPLGATKLFEETIAPVAHAKIPTNALLGRESLSRVTLLEFDVAGRPWLHWSDWLAAHGMHTSMARGILHFNQYDQMIQAAIAGQGIALGRLKLLQPMLRDGRLKLIDMEMRNSPSPFSYWLLQADKNPSEEVRRVVEWILTSAAEVADPVPESNEPEGD
jgi:LysR family transcriptional regulator, glycine cleavage system transcriptional activator